MTTTTQRRIGERVSVNHPKFPGVWIVRKLLPVNIILEPEGGGKQLKAAPSLLTDPVANGSVSVAAQQFYDPGELVRINDGRFAGVWVVIADKGGDKVNVAKLGGDRGHYLRAIRTVLNRVEPNTIHID